MSGIPDAIVVSEDTVKILYLYHISRPLAFDQSHTLETLEGTVWPEPAESRELGVSTDITLAFISRVFVFC